MYVYIYICTHTYGFATYLGERPRRHGGVRRRGPLQDSPSRRRGMNNFGLLKKRLLLRRLLLLRKGYF